MRDWLTLAEATRRYGVSRATLYRLIAAGRVRRGKRIGDRRAFVSATDVREATTIRMVLPSARRGRRRRGPA